MRRGYHCHAAQTMAARAALALPKALPMPLPLLLLTRPRPQSERFATAAQQVCPPHRTLIAPLSTITPLPFDPAPLRAAAGLVLTSANALPALASLDLPHGMPVWCVGPGTAAAAKAMGLCVRQSGGDAAHLMDDLLAARPKGPLVHVHGRHLAADLVAALSPHGIELTGLTVYAAEPVDWGSDIHEALAAGLTVAPLFSPRAAQAFAEQLAVDGRASGVFPVAISRNCADRLPDALRARTRLARHPNADSMLHATAETLACLQGQP